MFGKVSGQTTPYTVVDAGQTNSYSASGMVLAQVPDTNSVYYGQDAQFQDAPPSFCNNGDGTVSDLNTGLMWEQVPSTNRFTWSTAAIYAATNRLAGYSDWRLADIKELFSLAAYKDATNRVFIDVNYFTSWDPTNYGLNVEMGQTWAATPYPKPAGPPGQPQTNITHWMFNFYDGHLKANTAGPNWVRLVRGGSYGANQFVANGNGTVNDLATGLMWQQADDGVGRDWTNAMPMRRICDWPVTQTGACPT